MTILDQALHAVLQPVERANGLPNAAYTDPNFFEREKSALFGAGWAALGFASEVAAPGDVRPITFLGQPLLLARDQAGVLRVFYNVCRHRGMVLVQETGNLPRAIRCPYHSWCYELDGRLRTTPHVGGPGTNRHDSVDRESLGLIEVRSHVWLGVVWINLDGDAAPFEAWAGPLLERWSEFDRTWHTGPDSRFELDVKCNWKLAIENYCESYHLPWVHPGLNSYSRLEDHYHIEAPGRFAGQGTTVYRPRLSEDGRRFPELPNLGTKWDEGAEYIALFPNAMLGVHRDHAYAIVLDPVSHDRTVEKVAIFYVEPQVMEGDWAEMRARNAQMWKDVFVEDIFVVEGMQAGRHAAGFDGGRFSPAMDGPTHCFHAWAAERMAQTVAGASGQTGQTGRAGAT